MTDTKTTQNGRLIPNETVQQFDDPEAERARLLALYSEVLNSPGLSAVSNWVLPNDGAPADEAAILKRFEDTLDEAMEVSNWAMETISFGPHDTQK